MELFRIVLFSSMPAPVIQTFLRRLTIDLPQVTVAGVLYETERPPLCLKRRLKLAARNVRDPAYLRYIAHRVESQFQFGERLLDPYLRFAHAAPPEPNGPPLSIEQLKRACEETGMPFEITDDIHQPSSIAFVQRVCADLGVVYGTRILKPELFSIPRLGSINIHKHKVPQYRGSGAPGLWELRDGATEQSVTIHRVLREVDAGAVLGERTFPIQPYDTLTSVGLKADLLGLDCLVDVIRQMSRGVTMETPQLTEGRLYKGFQTYQIWTIEQAIRRKRKPFKAHNDRPLYKLLPRMAIHAASGFRNRRRAQSKTFPVLVLYHHIVTDRPKITGISTEQFLQQIQFLKKHYRIASLPEAIELLDNAHVAEPTVVLTFDDGYEDNFLCLRAVAEAENVPITLFIATEHITKSSPFKHDLDRQEFGFPAMNWDQVRYLDRHGVTIGSHTRSHFDCGSKDTAALNAEIAGSLEDLRRELGHDVPYFAFPWGQPQNISQAARCIALETYRYVFSASGGVNHGPVRPGAVIRRCSHPQSLLELELLLQSLLDFHPSPPGAWASPGAIEVSSR